MLPRGPFVTIAAFCERTRSNPSEKTKDLMGLMFRKQLRPNGVVDLVYVVAVNCGEHPTTPTITITFRDKAGKMLTEVSNDEPFSSVGSEHILAGPVGFRDMTPGLLWMDVSIDGSLAARSPLLLTGRQAQASTRLH